MRAALASIWAALAQARLAFALAALVVYVLSLGIAGARFRLLLGAMAGPVSLQDTTLAHLAGIFVNNVTISSRIAGEAARAALIRMRASLPLPETTAAMAFERLSEVPPLAILVAIAAPALTLAAGGRARILAVSFVALVAIAAFTTPRWRRGLHAWLRRRFGEDRTLLPPRSAMMGAMAWSSLAWIQDVLRLWLAAAALRVALSIPQAATLSVLNVVAGWVPTVGGLGAVESGLVGGLMLFHVPFETAAAITAIERAISYGFGTSAGAAAIASAGAWRLLRRPAAIQSAQGMPKRRATDESPPGRSERIN